MSLGTIEKEAEKVRFYTGLGVFREKNQTISRPREHYLLPERQLPERDTSRIVKQ